MNLILLSYIQGIKNVWTNKFLVGIMFVFKLVFSLILLFPLYIMFSTSFATNVKASNFLTWFDLSLLIDFIYYWRKTLSIYFFLFLLFCIMGVIVFIFLSGGFWGVLRDQVKKRSGDFSIDPSMTRMERFFGYCGKYFWGMLKIGLFMIIPYLKALLLFLLFSTVFETVAGKGDLWELTSGRMVGKILIGVILFFLVNMIGDYLRIFFVENYGERFGKILKETFKFLLTNLFSALSLYYVLSVISVVVIFIYLGLNTTIERIPGSGFIVFLTFLIQQTLVVFSSYYRLVYYSSEVVLYDKLSATENAVSPQV